MAWTQVDLDTIESAIADGQRVVKLDNRLVEYFSMKEMLLARDKIKQYLDDLAVDSGLKPRRPRVYRYRGGKGL